MTDSTDPLIHIIPDLKELSATGFGAVRKNIGLDVVSKNCGRSGFTDENCIGDFNGGVLTKRNNYHTGNNKFPNDFLLGNKNFKVVPAGLVIATNPLQYLQNWNTLFQTINGIITQPQQSGGEGGIWPWSRTQTQPQPSQQPAPRGIWPWYRTPKQPQPSQQPAPSGFGNILDNATEFAKSATDSVSNLVQSDKKKNVFISCHQHVLQNMFFKFKKLEDKDLNKTDSCGKSMEQYGFRNCTCIKISNEGDKRIMITVIHSENTGRDKFKYIYINENNNSIDPVFLSSILVDGTYPISGENFPNGCDIYMIRHGEAVQDDIYEERMG